MKHLCKDLNFTGDLHNAAQLSRLAKLSPEDIAMLMLWQRISACDLGGAFEASVESGAGRRYISQSIRVWEVFIFRNWSTGRKNPDCVPLRCWPWGSI
jgi:hypothetical protein